MGIWSDGLKDTIKGASSFTYGWFSSAFVLGIIIFLIWVIVEIYHYIFGA